MKSSNHNTPYLVSSCLIGLLCRYDCKIKADSNCIKKLQNSIWIPVCPEQMGGLSTPREAADIIGGNGKDVLAGKARVITASGIDRTGEFIRGAHQVLTIARAQRVQGVILKARSPSCSVTGTIGVTAALLKENGFDLLEF